MATRPELEDALRNAHAAGDVESARTLADALAGMSADTSGDRFPGVRARNPSFADPNTVPDPNNPAQRIPRTSAPPDWSKAPEVLNDMARGVADYGTFGQANRVSAALGAATGVGGEFGEYGKNLATQRSLSEEAKNRPTAGAPGHPGTPYNTGAGLGLVANPANRWVSKSAGSFLPTNLPGGLGLAKRYANYGLTGGILNTLYEATLGDKEKVGESAAASGGLAAAGMVAPEGGGAARAALDHGKNFVKGAGLGVLPPAALETAGPVAKFIFSPILKRINPDEAFFAGLGRALQRSKWTPKMFGAKMDKMGDAGMPANVGSGVTDYARDIAQFPGQARTQAQAAFNVQSGGKMATTGGAPGRVENAINSTLTDETARATTTALVDLRTRTSRPLWGRLFMRPATPTPAARPQGAMFSGVELPPQGPGPALVPKVPQSDVLDVLATNPEIQRGMAIGQSTARNMTNAEGRALDPGRFEVDGRPTLEAWHSAKEGLDDILFSGGDNIVNPLTGQLTKYGKSINDMRKSVLEELKLHYPEYDEALQAWAGPTQATRMIDLGAKLAKGDARVTADLIADLTPNELEFIRIGLADQAKYLVSKTRTGSNVVNAIFADQNQRRNLALLFPNRRDFNEFRKVLAAEEKMHTSKQAVLGGSPTAPRLLGAEEQAKDIGRATIEGAQQGGATGAAAGFLGRGWNYLKAEPERVRDVAGSYLFSTDPARRAELIRQLQNQYDKGQIYGNPGLASAQPYGLFGLKTFGF